MFDSNEPGYLGGLTTQLQDSMKGVQYGRSNVNEDGRFIPNDAASGRAYENMPVKNDANMTQKTVNGNDALSVLQSHVNSLMENSKAVEFFGLTMPSKLIESTPDPRQWMKSAMLLEQALQEGLSLKEQLSDPRLSVARLALEFIQNGTAKMDSAAQIIRTQSLISHFKNHFPNQEIVAIKTDGGERTANKEPEFRSIWDHSLKFADEIKGRPRIRIGQFSIPQFLSEKAEYHPNAIKNSLAMLQKQIMSQKSELLFDPTELTKAIIITILSEGMVNPSHPESILPKVNKLMSNQITQSVRNQDLQSSPVPMNVKKTLSSIHQVAIEILPIFSQQEMVRVGAYAFPAEALTSPDAGMFTREGITRMLMDVTSQLASGSDELIVHNDSLETGLVIAFLSGVDPSITNKEKLHAEIVALMNADAQINVNAQVNANANYTNVNANYTNANANEESFFSTTKGKALVGAGIVTAIYAALKSKQ